MMTKDLLFTAVILVISNGILALNTTVSNRILWSKTLFMELKQWKSISSLSLHDLFSLFFFCHLSKKIFNLFSDKNRMTCLARIARLLNLLESTYSILRTLSVNLATMSMDLKTMLVTTASTCAGICRENVTIRQPRHALKSIVRTRKSSLVMP